MQGIKISEGIAIANMFKIEAVQMDLRKLSVEDSKQEIAMFHEGIHQTRAQLDHLKTLSLEKFGQETSSIFDAHLVILEDPDVTRQIEAVIRNESCNAEYAIRHVVDGFVKIFQALDDDYLKERAIDLIDVSNRLLKNMLGMHPTDLSGIDHPVILVADELTPSETAQINTAFVKGIATEMGGKTSHASIIAKLLGIPMVIGIKGLMKEAVHGNEAILDANRGEILLTFDEDLRIRYEDALNQYHIEKTKLTSFVDRVTQTKDGHRVHLFGNITTDKDLPILKENDGEGVGLFRTEFLFLDQDTLPTEDEQFNLYKAVLETLHPKPVVIRTLDVGGDKTLPGLMMTEELNPFLGRRAIRLYQSEASLFETHVRAMLRASAFGNLHIMFPMIATFEEWRWAKSIVEKAKVSLIDQGIEIHPYKLGIMIEVPSAALSAELFAKEVDFFSIGTNDLIQYLFAADRTNDAVSYLYQPYHPVVLKLIKEVTDAAKRHDKAVAVCGEMASDLYAGPLLVGLGVDELSMTPPLILKMRKRLSELNLKKLQQLASDVLKLESEEAVIDRIKKVLPI